VNAEMGRWMWTSLCKRSLFYLPLSSTFSWFNCLSDIRATLTNNFLLTSVPVVDSFSGVLPFYIHASALPCIV
jgi:hypothetical protein